MSGHRARKCGGPDLRGSTRNRRARKLWMLETWGDGERCPCVHCGGMLDYSTVTADRIVPGVEGGRYTRDNVQPSCIACNIARGGNGYEGHPDAEVRTAAELERDAESVVFETAV